jgi:hypothetical protein
MKQEGNDEKNQEDEEKDLRDSGERRGHSGETEQRREQRYDEKNDCPNQHVILLAWL